MTYDNSKSEEQKEAERQRATQEFREKMEGKTGYYPYQPPDEGWLSSAFGLNNESDEAYNQCSLMVFTDYPYLGDFADGDSWKYAWELHRDHDYSEGAGTPGLLSEAQYKALHQQQSAASAELCGGNPYQRSVRWGRPGDWHGLLGAGGDEPGDDEG